MADALDADVSIAREITLKQLVSQHANPSDRTVLEAIVRRRYTNQDQCCIDIRVAILGGHGEGKSTLLGYITHGIQDNGRGRSRLSCARHRHEIESGRTSSVSQEVIGYDADGNIINYAKEHIVTWEQICEASAKIITFLDLCGHSRYLRTTISGMSGYCPDYAALVISGNLGGISEMTREHLAIAVMLQVPVFVIVTKVDLATRGQLQNTLNSLVQLIRSPGMRKIPIIIRNHDDFFSYGCKWAYSGPEVPIFLVSNVTGTNIDLLHKFFSSLHKSTKEYNGLLEDSVEFQIEKTYSIQDVGIVIGGVLRKGRITTEEPERMFYLGPDAKGCYIQVQVRSIHRHRIPANSVHCGQVATLAITSPDLEYLRIQRGMVLLGVENPTSYLEFEAEMLVLYHPTGVTVGTCGMFYSGSIRQLARVIAVTVEPTVTNNIHGDCKAVTISNGNDAGNASIISSGKEGRCILRFMNEPQYLCIDARLLFVEGKAKCLGRITRVLNV
ncbi:P-loop containing nucleoside triphosphate hydrolase protein [Dichotomocladium elegans]|nr:P-loop containing nucleoside triphosphate hydrolase protein [Dichotomocladium elegans]